MPINQSIYGFAFIKNVSAYTLYRLKNVGCCYLLCGAASIDKYLEFLLHDQPEYILGLGQFFGSQQNQIRIETKCANNFKNRAINSQFGIKETVRMVPFLKPQGLSVLSESIGNSYCNLVSWKIMELINKQKLKSKYTFIHIPKYMPVRLSTEEINQLSEGFYIRNKVT